MRRFNSAIPKHEGVRGGRWYWPSSAEYRESTLSGRVQMGARKKGHPLHCGLNQLRQTAAVTVKDPLPRSIATDTLVRCNIVPVCAIRGETIIFMNERCSALLGRSGDELVVDIPLRDVVAAADWPRVQQGLLQAITKLGGRTTITLRVVRKDGSILDVELACAVAPGEEPPILVSVVSDITDKTRAHTQLNYLAFTDALTRLPNRALFFDRLRQTLVASRRSGQRFALLVCDLDNFKGVNDTHGHAAGDVALQLMAERLRSCCREEDTAARMGGDEFVVILPGVAEPAQAALVCARVITALDEPVTLGGLSCRVGVSIGIAFHPQDGRTIESLYQSADAAMYVSKAAGKNRFSFSDERGNGAAATEWSLMGRTDVHETGVGIVDAQHQTLAVMIRKLGIDFAAGEEVRHLRDSFAAIIRFAQSHFAAEEALMDRYAIKNRMVHKQMHGKLLQDARSLAKDLDQSSMMVIMGSLNDWLLQHVESADRPLARQLHEKGYVDAPW